MNERIKKLLAQAHLECGPDTNKVAERYAELIVKECANTASDFVRGPGGDHGVKKAIQEYFGVEE